jgi:hypothetical protein
MINVEGGSEYPAISPRPFETERVLAHERVIGL